MAGSLRQVAGKQDVWELRVYLGRDDQGRVKHRHARVTGSYVFSYEVGGPVPPYPDSFSHAMIRLRKAAGLP
jgi:hypothetical protein